MRYLTIASLVAITPLLSGCAFLENVFQLFGV